MQPLKICYYLERAVYQKYAFNIRKSSSVDCINVSHYDQLSTVNNCTIVIIHVTLETLRQWPSSVDSLKGTLLGLSVATYWHWRFCCKQSVKNCKNWAVNINAGGPLPWFQNMMVRSAWHFLTTMPRWTWAPLLIESVMMMNEACWSVGGGATLWPLCAEGYEKEQNKYDECRLLMSGWRHAGPSSHPCTDPLVLAKLQSG